MNPNCYKNQKARGLKRKLEAIESHGGKCSNCGYSKNIAALDFHHKNPDEKEYQLDVRHFANTNPDKLKEELDKCILLCANCHREIHNQNLDFSLISDLNCTKKGLNNLSGSICPVCGKRFPKMKGKIYCSSECRKINKKYPSIDELNEQYKLLKNWNKVASYFGITRKITQNIRKKNS